MVHCMDHDCFINCDFVSQSTLRNIFGAWVTVYAAVIAFCVYSIFHSRVTIRLLSDNRKISLWATFPAMTLAEVYEMRGILLRALRSGNFSYLTASLFCVAAAVINASSTSIANHAVTLQSFTYKRNVSGSQIESNPTFNLDYRIPSHAQAFANADAPLDQLLDFVPDDDSGWIFIKEEWDNTWQGECVFNEHPAVELKVFDVASTDYQDLIPGLDPLIPDWAKSDRLQQGQSAIYTMLDNAWRDYLIIYAFGSSPSGTNESSFAIPTINISIANVLLHNVPFGNGTTTFSTSEFKSDVHVVECIFNSSPTIWENLGPYYAMAGALSNVYMGNVTGSSTLGQNVKQPTAKEMLRSWQAYQMEGHASQQTSYRTLTVSKEVVQLRLSITIFTIATSVLALAASVFMHFRKPLDECGDRTALPQSRLDWMVEAARQHGVGGGHQSLADYAKKHGDLVCVFSTARDGVSRVLITSDKAESITLPFLGCPNCHLQYDKSVGSSATSTLGGERTHTSQPSEECFNPYSLYDDNSEESTTVTVDQGKPTL